MTIPNPLAAVIAYLAGDTDVAALAAARVYGESLPDGQAGAMPRACVVIAASPGAMPVVGRSRLPLYPLRFDAKCYGESAFEATQVFFAVHQALVTLDRVVVGDALLHDVIADTSMMQLRDADGKWPLCFASFTVLAATQAVS